MQARWSIEFLLVNKSLKEGIYVLARGTIYYESIFILMQFVGSSGESIGKNKAAIFLVQR